MQGKKNSNAQISSRKPSGNRMNTQQNQQQPQIQPNNNISSQNAIK